ncbi:MAG: minor capsid protein [Bryobacteraceae bacterium]
MTLTEIATYLASLGIGTLQVDLFTHFMPPAPDFCITVYAYGGRTSPDVWKMGESHVQREYPRIHVEVRGVAEDADTPEAKIKDIYRLLSMTAPTLLSGTQYWTITPLQPPFPVKKDDNQRYIFACNFEIFKEVTA